MSLDPDSVETTVCRLADVLAGKEVVPVFLNRSLDLALFSPSTFVVNAANPPPDVVLGRDDLVQLGNVWMMQLAMVVNFPRERGGHGFGYLLDSDTGAGQAVDTHSDLAICPCSAELPLSELPRGH